MKISNIIILFCLAGFCAVQTIAQTDPHKVEMTVVAPYQPDIKDANKINFNPVSNDTTEPKPNFSYKILNNQIKVKYEPEAIEAAKMTGEPITKLYSNYLKAGGGSYFTSYGEYWYMNTRSKTKSFGGHVKHKASSGKIQDYGFPGFSENAIDLNGSYYKDKQFNLTGKTGFSRDVVHFYGYNPTDFTPEPSKNDIKQRFSTIKLSGKISSVYTDSSKVGYQAGLDFYHLTDKFNTREMNICVYGKVGQTKKFSDLSPTQHWELKTAVDFFNDKSATWSSHSSAIVTLNPAIETKVKDLEIRFGIKTEVEADSTAFLRIHPDIKLGLTLIPYWLRLNAGFDGGTERNSFFKFIQENPFVVSDIQLMYKDIKYRIYGGINSTLFHVLDVQVSFSKSQIKNMPFYVNDLAMPYQNKFRVIYDDDCGLFEINSEIAYQWSEVFRSMIRFNYHQYTTSTNQALPWQRPDYDFSIGGKYNLQNKILVGAEFIYYDRMYALSYNSQGKVESKFIRSRPDFNLSFEYRYTKMLSAFINLNNLTNTRYYFWNNYPSQKFNVLAGLTFTF